MTRTATNSRVIPARLTPDLRPRLDLRERFRPEATDPDGMRERSLGEIERRVLPGPYFHRPVGFMANRSGSSFA